MSFRATTAILLTTLLVTGVFGVLLMSVVGQEDMTCALPSMGNMDCAVFSNALAMLEHHVGVYQGLLTALLTMTAVVLLTIFWRTAVAWGLFAAPPRWSAWSVRPDEVTTHDRLLHRWLACLRMQDAFAYARVHAWSS